jgi:hypothetical protein
MEAAAATYKDGVFLKTFSFVFKYWVLSPLSTAFAKILAYTAFLDPKASLIFFNSPLPGIW